MAMGIGQNIEDVRQQIIAGTVSGRTVAEEAKAAMFAGLGSIEWETFMGRFADNDDELNRLCGRDEAFNKRDWGLFCLAYIVGDGTCTSETANTTGTKRSMTLPELAGRDLLGLLDE